MAFYQRSWMSADPLAAASVAHHLLDATCSCVTSPEAAKRPTLSGKPTSPVKQRDRPKKAAIGKHGLFSGDKETV